VPCSANLLPISTRKEDRLVMERTENNNMPERMGWRVAATILTLFGSIVGIILWLFFYAGSFNVYQNIAIIVAIIMGFVAVMGAIWASWGLKQKAYWTGKGRPGSC
jgi:hypothetical protein